MPPPPRPHEPKQIQCIFFIYCVGVATGIGILNPDPGIPPITLGSPRLVDLCISC